MGKEPRTGSHYHRRAQARPGTDQRGPNWEGGSYGSSYLRKLASPIPSWPSPPGGEERGKLSQARAVLSAQAKASPQLQGPELLCGQDSQGAQRTLLQNLGSDTLVHSQTHSHTYKLTNTPRNLHSYTHPKRHKHTPIYSRSHIYIYTNTRSNRHIHKPHTHTILYLHTPGDWQPATKQMRWDRNRTVIRAPLGPRAPQGGRPKQCLPCGPLHSAASLGQ